jgi:hypothetical protein
LETPAITLAVLAGIGLAFTVIGLLLNVVTAVANDAGIMDGVVLQLVSVFVSGVIHGVVLTGAIRMRQLKNYPLAVTAAILAMLPCNGCCIVGLPIGIWALVVLCDRSVRAAFR